MMGVATRWPKSFQGLMIGFIGIVMAVAVWALGWLDPWEAKTWDWRAKVMAAPGTATGDIVLILLDQQSLDWARKENGLTWPWPREVYGAIVDYCKRAGAKALAFDVLFTEPSAYGVADDAALARAIAAFGRFAGTVFLGQSTGDETVWPKAIPRPTVNVSGLDRWLAQSLDSTVRFPRATLPVLEIAKSVAVLGNVHLTPDTDGIYRRIRLFHLFEDTLLPALGLGTYLAAHPKAAIGIGPGKFSIDGRNIPADPGGNVILRYRGPSGTHRAFSAAAVIQSELRIIAGQPPTIAEADAFRDKYVFFGFSAPGLYDLRSSPVDGVYPGVEIHATVLDNFLSGDFIRRAPTWLTLTAVVFAGAGCGLLASVFTSAAGAITVSALFLTAPVLGSLAAYAWGFWLPLTVQELASVLTVALSLVVNYATEGRQKRFIKNAFRQYLSPAVIDQLIQHPERLKLGGERRTLSIFFSDLQGFTSISEGMDAQALTELLNDYLSAMTDIIHEEGGTVDKYEGDAIIAFWNAPLTVGDHAVRIVRAALKCQQRLAELRPVFRKRTGKDIFMRIGINTGPAVVGNLGSHSRFDYTMLGDAVNLAARLEGANKQFGTYTMISESTRVNIGDRFPVRELARVAVVGRKAPVTVYEPMSARDYAANRGILETFAKGLALFYAGDFQSAAALFSQTRQTDPAAAAYAIKCDEMAAVAPENWRGIWVMTSK